MMILDVVIEDGRWETVALEKQAEVAIAATLDCLGLGDEDWEVSILGCDDPRIAELNADFRQKSKATNVLSWLGARAGRRGGGRDAARAGDGFHGRCGVGRHRDLI